jgi:hypothetical protein
MVMPVQLARPRTSTLTAKSSSRLLTPADIGPGASAQSPRPAVIEIAWLAHESRCTGVFQPGDLGEREADIQRVCRCSHWISTRSQEHLDIGRLHWSVVTLAKLALEALNHDLGWNRPQSTNCDHRKTNGPSPLHHLLMRNVIIMIVSGAAAHLTGYVQWHVADSLPSRRQSRAQSLGQTADSVTAPRRPAFTGRGAKW